MKAIFVATICLLLTISAAPAQQLLDSYTARLGKADHFNSSGTRLKSAAAIIRQDRANYWVFGSYDLDDEPDHYFKNKANRARLERMLNNGKFSRDARRAVVNGTPLIHVEVYADFINVYVDDE